MTEQSQPNSASPTPWRENDLTIMSDDGDIICRIPNHPDNGKRWKTDAPLIVKAVNNHDALVKALQDILDASNCPYEVARSALAALDNQS